MQATQGLLQKQWEDHMWTWLDSLRTISVLNWICRFAGAAFGVLIVLLSLRESALSRLDRQKEKQDSDLKIASLNTKAASLEVDAENARKEIATAQAQAAKANEGAALANERAAQANEKAEAERLERTKLEASLQPRSIISTTETFKELQLFSGITASIRFSAGDEETASLVGQLLFMLKEGKWSVVRTEQVPYCGDGVSIYTMKANFVPPTVDGNLRFEKLPNEDRNHDAATILSYQLKDNGMSSSAMPIEKDKWSRIVGMPADADVSIVIGPKRNYYFMDKAMASFDRVVREHLPESVRKTLPPRLPLEDPRQAIEKRAPFMVAIDKAKRVEINAKYRRQENKDSK
jgi:hypothetical protein